LVYEPVRTLADLVRVCQIDTDVWEITHWRANKWESAAKDDRTQKLVTRPLYQVTATMRRKGTEIIVRAAIAALIADAKTQIKPRAVVKRIRPAGQHMLEIAVPDLHLGKLAWSEETRGANYDHRIAVDVFRAAVTSLVERTAAFNFSRVVFVLGNDFLHADTAAGTTTRGTPLDMDSRYHKLYRVGRELLVETIDRLRQVAPVEVPVVPGNHDTLSAFTLGDSLECWYHNTPHVTIDNAAVQNKYMQHGAVMLMWTHGDKGKKNNYPLLMATEQPKMFAATIHRECHTGHLHKLQADELMGVRTRICPSLAPADAWHAQNHLVNNARSAEGYVWHPDEGLVSLAVYTVPREVAP